MTKPNHEHIACANLARQGYMYWLPRFWFKKQGKAPVLRPLFPRYVFIQIENTWHSIAGTRGISYILMGHDYPQVVPEAVIDTFRSREDGNGIYQMDEPEKYKKGQVVKAKSGPLAGLPLIYEGMSGCDRVKVLADMLGRKVQIEIPEGQLVA